MFLDHNTVKFTGKWQNPQNIQNLCTYHHVFHDIIFFSVYIVNIWLCVMSRVFQFGKPWQTLKAPKCHTCVLFFSLSMETEQRTEYKGVDVKSHPVPKSCKKEPQMYKPPDEKVETVTSQRVRTISWTFSILSWWII